MLSCDFVQLKTFHQVIYLTVYVTYSIDLAVKLKIFFYCEILVHIVGLQANSYLYIIGSPKGALCDSLY